MTLRARPVARRRGRAGWDPGDRRNSLINLGFFLAIGFSILLLDRLRRVQLVRRPLRRRRDRQRPDRSRTTSCATGSRSRASGSSYFESRIATLLAKGRLTENDYQSQLQFVQQQRSQLAIGRARAPRRHHAPGQARHGQRSIEVSDAEIDAQVAEESTTAGGAPRLDDRDRAGRGPRYRRGHRRAAECRARRRRSAPCRASRAASRGRTSRGRSPTWASPRRRATSAGCPRRAATTRRFMDGGVRRRPQHADRRRRGRGRRVPDRPRDRAGAGGGRHQLRIAACEADGIAPADYRAVARADLVREKLSDAVVADLSQPGPQRHVLEIFLPEPNESTLGDRGRRQGPPHPLRPERRRQQGRGPSGRRSRRGPRRRRRRTTRTRR